jgi:2-polyprenyl-3-methyl-5-hydroxy-6-metoxy-1,4-benzoquinol methylase
MFTQLLAMMKKPDLYEKGAELWTDEHISKGMLEAHLNPDWDAATRKHATVREIVKWIGSVARVEQYRDLLDLGCGPGIYAEEFHKAGYRVSGMDFSERSINYARNSAQEKNLPITYHHHDYLTMDFQEQFDLITLIYYDFGTLPTEDRAQLLKKINTALRPGGLLIVEVLTAQHFSGQKEHKSWEYADKGFFSAEPHLCLNSFYRYDEQSTILQQHFIITERNVRHINIWEHTFSKDELAQDISTAGLSVKTLYRNMTGADYCDDGKEMCVVAQKEGN